MAADASGRARTLILVRHAQTRWNHEGRFQGQLDSPVTEEGVAQIDAVARRLRDTEIDAVYTSDLGRSILTADRIARLARAPVVVDVRLRERGYGLFEGLTAEMAQHRHPDLMQQARDSTDANFTIPFGESKQALLERVLPALREAAQRPGRGNVVVIGHGGMLRVFFNHVAGLPLTHRNGRIAPNCSVSVVEYAGGRWCAQTIGDVAHLPVLE